MRHLQGKGVYCLNKEQAFLAARDKWRSLQMLLEKGIAVPNSVLSGCEVEPKQAIKQTTAPMIIKTLKGSQGIGVILVERPQSAVSILECLLGKEKGSVNLPYSLSILILLFLPLYLQEVRG